jgi:hypothetical protein
MLLPMLRKHNKWTRLKELCLNLQRSNEYYQNVRSYKDSEMITIHYFGGTAQLKSQLLKSVLIFQKLDCGALINKF